MRAAEVAPTAVAALHGSGQTARARRLVAEFAAAGTEQRDASAARAPLTVCRALLAEADGGPDDAVGPLADAEGQWRGPGRPFDAARGSGGRRHPGEQHHMAPATHKLTSRPEPASSPAPSCP
ncbi:hypothetical protein AB0H82_07375 [Streptomyces sp. NPDC050732]|uniref:hypothetical protein n=1 Tax=Streptomyces sp. NPDC050732 TaxID=3154632 RepID=UPI003414ACE5